MVSPTSPLQILSGCQHIQGLLANARDKATENYDRLITSLRGDGAVSDRLHKSAGSGRIRATAQTTYLCLQCPNVSLSRERHRKEHAFSVESRHGFIYCHECKDFVYDATFEEIRSRSRNSKKRKASELSGGHDGTISSVVVGGGGGGGSEQRLVSTNSSSTPCAASGLRGLYNMGQTCFMSVVIQSLIHNPLIRTFYLAEGHKSGDCEREACTACALDDIFTDFFGHEKHEGYGAVHMLQGCWKGGGGLAGYSQQDAHEYLGFILNSLHSAITDEDDANGNSNGNGGGGGSGTAGEKSRDTTKDCDCVIHQTFGGLLKSTVTCSTCNNTTTALDPFMDLSLDVRSNAVTTKKKLALINGTTTVKLVPPMDLAECLSRFTSPETLSSDSYFCRKCDSSQEAKKEMSLSRLPPVIPIHLKRFSHSKTLATSAKVDTKIRFPFTLDFTPYCSSSSSSVKTGSATAKKKHGTVNEEGEAEEGGGGEGEKDAHNDTGANRENSSSAGTANGTSHDTATKSTQPDPVYELSSVIVHKGKIDNGHYISYSRQGDEWFRFDDSMVVQVDEKEVLAAEAYILVYVVREFG